MMDQLELIIVQVIYFFVALFKKDNLHIEFHLTVS